VGDDQVPEAVVQRALVVASVNVHVPTALLQPASVSTWLFEHVPTTQTPSGQFLSQYIPPQSCPSSSLLMVLSEHVPQSCPSQFELAQ
jgi:hypothetical protein